MALNTNQHYFDISIQNPEELDLRYAHIEWDSNLNQYVETTKVIGSNKTTQSSWARRN